MGVDLAKKPSKGTQPCIEMLTCLHSVFDAPRIGLTETCLRVLTPDWICSGAGPAIKESNMAEKVTVHGSKDAKRERLKVDVKAKLLLQEATSIQKTSAYGQNAAQSHLTMHLSPSKVLERYCPSRFLTLGWCRMLCQSGSY